MSGDKALCGAPEKLIDKSNAGGDLPGLLFACGWNFLRKSGFNHAFD
ncbi:hypothetical protein [Herbaspirillum robiniae]